MQAINNDKNRGLVPQVLSIRGEVVEILLDLLVVEFQASAGLRHGDLIRPGHRPDP